MPCSWHLVVSSVKLRDGTNPIGACDCQAHIKLPEQQVQSWLQLHARMAHQYPLIYHWFLSSDGHFDFSSPLHLGTGTWAAHPGSKQRLLNPLRCTAMELLVQSYIASLDSIDGSYNDEDSCHVVWFILRYDRSVGNTVEWTLSSSLQFEYARCCQHEHLGSRTCSNKILQFLTNWVNRLMQVDLYNGCKQLCSELVWFVAKTAQSRKHFCCGYAGFYAYCLGPESGEFLV